MSSALRIVSRDNLMQASTIAGALAAVVGTALVNAPNPWASIVGQILVGLGGVGIGHNER